MVRTLLGAARHARGRHDPHRSRHRQSARLYLGPHEAARARPAARRKQRRLQPVERVDPADAFRRARHRSDSAALAELFDRDRKLGLPQPLDAGFDRRGERDLRGRRPRRTPADGPDRCRAARPSAAAAADDATATPRIRSAFAEGHQVAQRRRLPVRERRPRRIDLIRLEHFVQRLLHELGLGRSAMRSGRRSAAPARSNRACRSGPANGRQLVLLVAARARAAKRRRHSAARIVIGRHVGQALVGLDLGNLDLDDADRRRGSPAVGRLDFGVGRRQFGRHVARATGPARFRRRAACPSRRSPSGTLSPGTRRRRLVRPRPRRLTSALGQRDDLIARLNSRLGRGTVGIDEAHEQSRRLAGQAAAAAACRRTETRRARSCRPIRCRARGASPEQAPPAARGRRHNGD